jgi:hypothetical protein
MRNGRMRVWAPTAISVVFIAVMSVNADARAAPDACARAHSRTIAASAQVRVYDAGRRAQFARFACSLKTRRVSYLGRGNLDIAGSGIQNETAAGNFAGYQAARCDRLEGDCRRSDVRVIDARTGKIARSPRLGIGAIGLAGLALRGDGALAYVTAVSMGMSTVYEVHRFAGGSDTVLDTGPDVDPLSLALGSSTVYWTRAGIPRSAPETVSGRERTGRNARR